MGRGLIVLLIVSILLNIFGVGFISGRMLDHEPHRAPEIMRSGGHTSPFRMMRHAEELPPEKRDAFRDVIKAGLPSARENHETVRRLQGELSELFASDELDRAAISAKMTEIRSEQARQREVFDIILVEAMATLSAEERRLMIKAANERREKFRERRGRKRHHERESD